MSLISGAAIGILGVHTRLQFAAENEAPRKKLSDSEARLRKILSASPDTVSIIRRSDFLVCDILGDRPFAVDARRHMIGKRLSEMDLYVDNQMLPAFEHALSEQGEFHDIEMEYKTADGRRMQSLISAATVEIEGESYIVSFARDITELKRVQRSLEEIERRFRAVYLAMPGAAGIMSRDGRFLDLSKPVEGSGYTREEVIGRTVDEIGFWTDPAERHEYDLRIKRDGFVTGMEIQMGCKDGG